MTPIDFSAVLDRITGSPTEVRSVSSISGGSINQCFRLATSQGDFFAKVNHANRFPKMFEAEQKGLELLKRGSSFRIPEVFGIGVDGDYSVLVMEHLNRGPAPESSLVAFGRTLAAMHQVTADTFGLDHDNYIGSLDQANTQHDDWASFYVEMRLQPLLGQAIQRGLLDQQDVPKVETMMTTIKRYFPLEAPSLLHGDLWSGNYFFTQDGHPSIFDPAVYYGHRYMDLGMMQLFGGFDDLVFEAYNEVYPLPENWRVGTELANLYPVLVHVVLFGSGDVSQAKSILQKFA